MANVTLGDHYEAMVTRMVESGRYSTVSEVIRDSLRLLEDREQTRAMKLEALRAAIAEGDESGLPEPLDMVSIKAEGRRLRQAEKR